MATLLDPVLKDNPDVLPPATRFLGGRGSFLTIFGQKCKPLRSVETDPPMFTLHIVLINCSNCCRNWVWILTEWYCAQTKHRCQCNSWHIDERIFQENNPEHCDQCGRNNRKLATSKQLKVWLLKGSRVNVSQHYLKDKAIKNGFEDECTGITLDSIIWAHILWLWKSIHLIHTRRSKSIKALAPKLV